MIYAFVKRMNKNRTCRKYFELRKLRRHRNKEEVFVWVQIYSTHDCENTTNEIKGRNILAGHFTISGNMTFVKYMNFKESDLWK